MAAESILIVCCRCTLVLDALLEGRQECQVLCGLLLIAALQLLAGAQQRQHSGADDIQRARDGDEHGDDRECLAVERCLCGQSPVAEHACCGIHTSCARTVQPVG